jgi:DNA-directed RNA polymerase subunit omega
MKIEQVVDKIGNRFSTVVVAARRARDIQGYYAHLGQGIGQFIPPQVHTYARKPLTIAMEEILEDKVVLMTDEPSEESASDTSED